MRFTPLEDSDLGIDNSDMAALIEPLIGRRVPSNDAAWHADLTERKRKILRKYLKRRLLAWLPAHQRSEAVVDEEYDEVWSKTPYESYGLEALEPKLSPWIWRGECLYARAVVGTRIRQLLFGQFIEKTRPRRVLEVGCGNGVNLLLLAGRFPTIEFAGIDLTEAGIRAATTIQNQETLPPAMQAFAPCALTDLAAFRRIDFRRGNATEMPFAEGEFDLVITSLAIEQMERVRARALGEIARVAGGHTLMIEPFSDVNAAFWARLNVRRRDYFQGRIDDLGEFGLHPLVAIQDFPQEAFLKAAAVLAEKK